MRRWSLAEMSSDGAGDEREELRETYPPTDWTWSDRDSSSAVWTSPSIGSTADAGLSPSHASTECSDLLHAGPVHPAGNVAIQILVRPKRQNRLGRKNRQALRNKQHAQDLTSADQTGDADEVFITLPQTEQIASSLEFTVWEPESPTSIAESADGSLLTVKTFEIEVEFTRSSASSASSYPLICEWLRGEPLARLVKYDREKTRGKLGETPTIIRGVGCEIVEDRRVMRVHYRNYGTFTYTRSCGKYMPSETPPSGSPQPLVWLPRQFTFESPEIGLPLPNIVAEWVQTGRRLPPRKHVPVCNSSTRISNMTLRMSIGLLGCIGSALLLINVYRLFPMRSHLKRITSCQN